MDLLQKRWQKEKTKLSTCNEVFQHQMNTKLK